MWSSDHHLLQWGAQAYQPGLTNNTMEALGLLRCLEWINTSVPGTDIHVFGDSSIIINQALGLSRARHRTYAH